MPVQQRVAAWQPARGVGVVLGDYFSCAPPGAPARERDGWAGALARGYVESDYSAVLPILLLKRPKPERTAATLGLNLAPVS